MSIDHGKVLALASEIQSAVGQAIEPDVQHVPVTWLLDWAARLRALAQPAEAVELPTPYHYADGGKGEPLFTANQVRAAVAVATDAAQGAVSDLSLIARRLLADQFPHQVTKDLLVIDGLADGVVDTRLALAAIENALRTHPQAAPAQGDGWKLVPVNATEEMRSAFAIAMGDTRILGAKEQFRIAYAKLLAATPSQEGE